MKNYWLGKKYYQVGYLTTGENVFCAEDGEHVKRTNCFNHLVEMTEKEMKSVMPERGEDERKRPIHRPTR